MYWGKAIPPTALSESREAPLLVSFLLDEAWNSQRSTGTGPNASGLMRMQRAGQATHRTLPGNAAFHVTLTATKRAIDELLHGDKTSGGERLKRYIAEGEHGCIELPLTDAARFCAESIRRCPFAGISRNLALTARGLDLLAEFMSALNGINEPIVTGHIGLHDTLVQVQAAAASLQSSLEHPPSISVLASSVGLSESTLKRGFRQLYRTTPFGYLRSRRMDYARELLATGKATVLEAAAFVGYSNPSNFASAFRKQFGVNPKTFQISARQ